MGAGSVAVFVLFLGLASAVRIDMCKVKPPVMKNFELLKLEGKWHEYARFPNLFQLLYKERCNSQDMTVDGDGIRFKTTFINETSGHEVSLYGNMTVTPTKPGKVLVNLPAIGLNDYYSIVDAKYDEYVVFYFSTPCGILK